MSILTATYEEPEARTRALAVALGGGAVGDLLGGALTGALSWRWIFFVNVPVGAALLTLCASRLRGPHPARLDLNVAGAITVTTGLMILVGADPIR